MPQVNRAWCSIDTDLYFWDYRKGGNDLVFHSHTHSVRSVALIKPRRGTSSIPPECLTQLSIKSAGFANPEHSLVTNAQPDEDFPFLYVGTFGNGTEYLLVTTTPLMIHVTGISFSDGADGTQYDRMNLVPHTTQAIATDNVMIDAIHGTSGGRIFLGGVDGNLYELVYGESPGVFSDGSYNYSFFCICSRFRGVLRW